MAKFYDVIGFVEPEKTAPGVYTNTKIVERKYYGDVVRVSKRFESGDRINDNLNVNNEISILSDPFANTHFYAMRYVKWMGTAWKINNVTVQYPRLILTIGGVYNGPQASTASDTGE